MLSASRQPIVMWKVRISTVDPQDNDLGNFKMLCWLRLRTLFTFVIRILTIVTDLQAENRLSQP